MHRWRAVFVLVAGLMMVLSSIAHLVFGWRDTGRTLLAAGVSPDLALGLKAGWYFGGAAMLIFGLIALSTYAGMRYRMPTMTHIALIGLGYFGFSLWALVASGFAPFFLLFLVPGLLLIAASWSSGDTGMPRE